MKPQIENFVTRKAQAELVTKLRADAKIERMDKPAKAEDKRPRLLRPRRSSVDLIHQMFSSMAGLVPAIDA